MPYVDRETREQFDERIDAFPGHGTPVGTMNYIITRLLLNTKPVTYGDFNALMGVLECCKQELYRRAVAVHEDTKRAKNGDVF